LSADRPPRIGLFGGSFDPPHNAHLALARSALDALALDQVRWIPAGQPWQKARSITPGAQREAMVRATIEGEPRFVLDRSELEREGPSYTLDTVRAHARQQPAAQWFLIIGADQYAGLHTWSGWQELLGLVTLAVANRPGPLPPVDPQVLRFTHRVVPLPMLDISATEIRSRVANGLPMASMVPTAVARYIDQHGLYRRS
jgi:nicotinate-nucleotide adenylyltransferase